MTALLTPAALRLAAAALARAGAGSALAALVLLVLASTVRAEGATAAIPSWESVLATGVDCPESTTGPHGGGWVLPEAHRAEGRFTREPLRPRQLPLGRKAVLLDRGGLPRARAP